ncbi:MAG TPA: hypothetical protein VN238_15580, partial [Solirubrobacteraceae bacterium]|nr:hypothetical protein [Solirubrobacteraceae bacterium]
AYLSGIRFDAVPRADGTLRVRVRGSAAAAARGTLTVSRTGLATGRLAGRTVRTRLRGGPPSA